MAKLIKEVLIKENIKIATDIYKMVLEDVQIAKSADTGMFINIYPKDSQLLLPRPISISEISDKTITIIYQIVGAGTNELSMRKVGDKIRISSALGQGYKIQNVDTHILVGGGIGVPPLVELAKRIPNKKIAVLGFRDEPILIDRLKEVGAEVYIATESGSIGFKGNVIELLKDKGIYGDYYYACGSKGMLKAIKQYCTEIGKEIQLSLEERMGCGYGACVGCVAKVDGKNTKICVEGPVFIGDKVTLS